MIAAKVGSAVGERMGIVVPAALYTGNSPEDRQGLSAMSIPFAATGPDAGCFIYQC